MKVLMTTDGSRDATTALRTACRLLRKTDHDVVDLLCVAPEMYVTHRKGKPGKAGSVRLREDYQRQIVLETERILAEGRQVLRAEGVEARPLARIGSPSRAIVQLAHDYDMTVVGARDRYAEGESGRGLGPVSSRVVAHGSGAVLVGRELAAERSVRVLLAVDGSLASERAVHLIASQFSLDSAEFTVMHVVETPWVRLGLEPEWFDHTGRSVERTDAEENPEHDLRLGVEEVVEDARTQLERFGFSATTMIEEGDPALEILSEAEKGEYDLIALGASGVAGLKHDMLGSVSSRVAQDAACSVLVVRFTE